MNRFRFPLALPCNHLIPNSLAGFRKISHDISRHPRAADTADEVTSMGTSLAAEYRRTSGGLNNLINGRGTNSFRGDAYALSLSRTAILGTIAATRRAVAGSSQADKRESALLARWGFAGAMAERFQAFKNMLRTLIEQLWLCHRGYLHGFAEARRRASSSST